MVCVLCQCVIGCVVFGVTRAINSRVGDMYTIILNLGQDNVFMLHDIWHSGQGSYRYGSNTVVRIALRLYQARQFSFGLGGGAAAGGAAAGLAQKIHLKK